MIHHFKNARKSEGPHKPFFQIRVYGCPDGNNDYIRGAPGVGPVRRLLY